VSPRIVDVVDYAGYTVHRTDGSTVECRTLAGAMRALSAPAPKPLTREESLVASLTALESWVEGGQDQGERSATLSDDGPHAEKLRWSVLLVAGDRSDHVYGATMRDALAQAAMVVGFNANLAEGDCE
jgi:hypothetical protein